MTEYPFEWNYLRVLHEEQNVIFGRALHILTTCNKPLVFSYSTWHICDVECGHTHCVHNTNNTCTQLESSASACDNDKWLITHLNNYCNAFLVSLLDTFNLLDCGNSMRYMRCTPYVNKSTNHLRDMHEELDED